MKKRILGILLLLCMILTLLPVTALATPATYVYVGGVLLNYVDTPLYATTNTNGEVIPGGNESNYNIKFENGTLTLRNAMINYEANTFDSAISSGGDLTIVAVGVNSVSRSNSSSSYSTSVFADALTFQGDGTLTVTSEQYTAIHSNRDLTVQGGINLIVVGGTATDKEGGSGMYAEHIIIGDNATVTAVGGKSSGGSGPIGSSGMNVSRSVTVQDNASVTAVGGDTTAGGNSAGIYAGISTATVNFTGAITIGGNARVVALGGKSGTVSYGLYADDGDSPNSGTISYTGGLLVTKGGQAVSSLAMNKVLNNGTDAVVTTASDSATNESKYCVVSPKSDGSADYHVKVGTVSSFSPNPTDGHIEWTEVNLALSNTVILGIDSFSTNALSMPDNATLTLSGFNVLLSGDDSSSTALYSISNLAINGSGSLVAIGGSGFETAGIKNPVEMSATGRITAISGSGTGGSSCGIFANTAPAIDSGSGVAIAGISGEDGTVQAFFKQPTTTGLATTGLWNGKVMTWGPVFILPSSVPATDTATVAKTAAIQNSVAFPMTTYPEGEYKVYGDGSTASEHGTVTASLSGNILMLTHASDIPEGDYYVSVTETGKAESGRLMLTVGPFVQTYLLTVNLNGGNGGTTGGSYAENTSISINAGTRTGYTFNGWTSSGGGTFGNPSNAATTFIVPANATAITANWSYNGDGDYGGGSQNPSTDNGIVTPGTGAPVIVDGKTVNIGTESKSGNTTTVTVDQTKLGKNISDAAAGSSVVIPVSESGSVTASLVLKNIEDMANKGMTLTVQTGNVAYNLNTAAIDRMALETAFPGVDMNRVSFDVTIQSSSVSVTGETLVVSPVAFTVTASYEGKTISVDTFNTYIDRVIEVTAEQAARITTAVVMNSDGSTRHVPTSVIEKDGKWYAIINSRTNSIYALIQNEVTFDDAESKWYEAAVNEMGSRRIIEGRSTTVFDGEAGITRAEFAAILVRAMGLPADGTSSFSDVSASAWYCGAVATAVQYGVTDGRGNNRFEPDAAITRQEAMLMLQRAATLTKFTGTSTKLDSFADTDSVASWAYDAVKWNVGSGLIQGADGKLNLTANITRAESAVIILRLLQKSGLVDVRSVV